MDEISQLENWLYRFMLTGDTSDLYNEYPKPVKICRHRILFQNCITCNCAFCNTSSNLCQKCRKGYCIRHNVPKNKCTKCRLEKKRCFHGNSKDKCRMCSDSGLCRHLMQRNFCSICHSLTGKGNNKRHKKNDVQ